MEENKEDLSMKQKVDMLFDAISDKKKLKKIKKIRFPRKAKVKRLKKRRGWIGILKVDENGNVSGERQQIEDSTFRLRDGTYHATDGREMLYWNGKFPFIIQPTTKENPVNVYPTKNETYGQKYIMARMLKDAIKIKNKGGNIIIWIIVGIIVIGGIYYFMNGGG